MTTSHSPAMARVSPFRLCRYFGIVQPVHQQTTRSCAVLYSSVQLHSSTARSRLDSTAQHLYVLWETMGSCPALCSTQVFGQLLLIMINHSITIDQNDSSFTNPMLFQL